MCGIAGYVEKNIAFQGPQVLKAETDVIAHRGPDGEGQWEGDSRDGQWHVGLGHRRLAIIDLEGGVQPMIDPIGRAVLVFNGEIYNFQELRAELEALGYQFHTHSDTEVLMVSYLEWGAKCVERFRGMFAFALWDTANQRLFMARDRFGKKPFYIWRDADRLVFGSEIKSVLAHPKVDKKLDKASVADFLTWRYVPAPNTFFAGIQKLAPATWAMFEKGKWTEASYWAPADASPWVKRDLGGDPVERFSEILDEAVRIRMVSDVPFGAFLSGGLDSSAIVALMSRHSAHPVNTFAVGYAEADYSELKYAKAVATTFKTNHTELIIAADDVISDLSLLTKFRDAPVAEPADVPIFRLSTEARKTVKMVLTGEGSDELLGGYPKHRAEAIVELYQKIMPAMAHDRLVAPLIDALPYSFRRAKTMTRSAGQRRAEERFPGWFAALAPGEIKNLLALDAPIRDMDPRPFRTPANNSAFRRILYFDQTSWLPDNLLERGDRMTMAVGIEGRMPFMDHELAEYCSRLPDNLRAKGLTGKWILRQAMANILPQVVLKRPKVGFRLPINQWFRTTLSDWVRELLLSDQSKTRHWYVRPQLEKIIQDHILGRHNHEKTLWMLISLELFQREYNLD